MHPTVSGFVLWAALGRGQHLDGLLRSIDYHRIMSNWLEQRTFARPHRQTKRPTDQPMCQQCPHKRTDSVPEGFSLGRPWVGTAPWEIINYHRIMSNWLEQRTFAEQLVVHRQTKRPTDQPMCQKCPHKRTAVVPEGFSFGRPWAGTAP